MTTWEGVHDYREVEPPQCSLENARFRCSFCGRFVGFSSTHPPTATPDELLADYLLRSPEERVCDVPYLALSKTLRDWEIENSCDRAEVGRRLAAEVNVDYGRARVFLDGYLDAQEAR